MGREQLLFWSEVWVNHPENLNWRKRMESDPSPSPIKGHSLLLNEFSLYHCLKKGRSTIPPWTICANELSVCVSCLKVACLVLIFCCLFVRSRISVCKVPFGGWRASCALLFNNFLRDKYWFFHFNLESSFSANKHFFLRLFKQFSKTMDRGS